VFLDRQSREVAMAAERGARKRASDRAPALTGRRVRLHPARAADADRLEAILHEPDVVAWWGGHEPDVKRIVREIFTDPDVVALSIHVEGEVVGLIQYEEENTPDYRHAAIDVFLATKWQGRGLGSEALRVLARYLFEERGHHRLTIDPAATNERAIRAYERVGFRRVGVMREYERGPDGVWRDGLLMDLLARELSE
jgi:aminoglycoside 6'-N-acetyltransferase